MLSAMALCASSQVSATAQPTRLIPFTGTQAVMPVISPSTTASNFQLLLFFHMHIYVATHIPPQSLEPQDMWHSAQETKSGERKDEITSGEDAIHDSQFPG